MKWRRWALAAAAVVVASSGCATVAPWQRSALADRHMQWDRHADRATLRRHVLAVREGAAPVEAGGGSACGCD
ncbi:MAG: DUF4266 domain-containing protein [Deltaproteobacteria bacterium]|nr:DUF4266 domain-containing protein [Deltaproteobacteria bacterium]